jgi:hypothetical protein
MNVTPQNIMVLVKLYTGLDSSICVSTLEKWSFDFYSSDDIDDEVLEFDSAGFDMSTELAYNLRSIAAFSKAAAEHVMCEIQKPKEMRKRAFIINSDLMYAGPQS